MCYILFAWKNIFLNLAPPPPSEIMLGALMQSVSFESYYP